MNVGRREWRYLKNGFLSDEQYIGVRKAPRQREHVLVKGYVVEPDELDRTETHEMLATLDRKARRLTV